MSGLKSRCLTFLIIIFALAALGTPVRAQPSLELLWVLLFDVYEVAILPDGRHLCLATSITTFLACFAYLAYNRINKKVIWKRRKRIIAPIHRARARTEKSLLRDFLLKYDADKDEENYVSYHFYRYLDTLKLLPKLGSFGVKGDVLDLGVGYGHLAYLIKRLYNYQVTALDFSTDYAIRLNKEGIKFKQCDLQKNSIPFDSSSFDLIMFCETIEHLAIDANLILREINRVLREGGKLIITTPNKLRARRWFQWKIFHRFNPEHYHEFTVMELNNLLLKNNFKIEDIILTNCWSKAVTHRKAKRGFWTPYFYFSALLGKMFPLINDCCMFKAEKYRRSRGA